MIATANRATERLTCGIVASTAFEKPSDRDEAAIDKQFLATNEAGFVRCEE